MRLSDETYEEIKRAVVDMFVNYNIKGVPINSFEIAIKLGITVVPYSALDTLHRLDVIMYSEDGFSVETNEGDWIIYYNNEKNNFGRINQTIMHEIGHYILGHVSEGEEEEAEAKFFAKYALASPPLIHNLIDRKNEENIMDAFDVSYEAASYALGYYKKWLYYGNVDYVVYERQMLCQLEIEVL